MVCRPFFSLACVHTDIIPQVRLSVLSHPDMTSDPRLQPCGFCGCFRIPLCTATELRLCQPFPWAGASTSGPAVTTIWARSSTPMTSPYASPQTGRSLSLSLSTITPYEMCVTLFLAFSFFSVVFLPHPFLPSTIRDDLVQITPGSDIHSFMVQTVSSGLTVLGVQGDATNPSLSDYTPLPVLPAISDPAATVRPGDVICFSSPLTGQQGECYLFIYAI